MPLFKRNFRSSSLSFPNTKSIISLLRSPYNYSQGFFWRGHSRGSKHNSYLLTEEEEIKTNQSLPLFVPHNIKQTSQRKTRKFEKISISFFCQTGASNSFVLPLFHVPWTEVCEIDRGKAPLSLSPSSFVTSLSHISCQKKRGGEENASGGWYSKI